MDIKLIMTIILIALIVILFIASLIGMWKGIWKTAFKMIFRTLLFVAMIFCAAPITNAVCSINFQSSFNLNVVVLDVPLTTLDSFLTGILMKQGSISPVTGQTLYATCFAMAHSILSFVIFFVLVILTLVLGSLFGAIFYHLIFKHFLPKSWKFQRGSDGKRHPRKIRWAGALFGLADGFICLIMIMSPISSLGNVVLDHQETISAAHNAGYLDDNTYQIVDKVTTAYGDSALGQSFKVLAPLTDEIMSSVVNAEVNGVKMNFLNEIDSLLGIITPIIDSVSKSGEELDIKLATLLAKQNIQNILMMIGNNTLIINVIPGLISMGKSMINDPAIADIINELDFSSIDWKNDFNALGVFYGKLYDAGIFGELPEIGGIKDIKLTVDMEHIDEYADAINSVTSLEVIDKNLAAIMCIGASAVNKTFNAVVLPESSDAYAGVDWTHELTCMTNTVAKVFKALGIDSLDFAKVNFQEKITTALKEPASVAQLKEAICGVAATETTAAKLGLLDLNMIDIAGVDDLIISTLDRVPSISDYVDSKTIRDIVAEVDLKTEIGAILDISSKIFELPQDENGNISFDIENPDQILAMKDLVNQVEDSSIITSMFPSMVKKMLKDSNISEDMLFGLSIDDLNFDFASGSELCSEVNDLLDIAGDANSIMKSTNVPEGGNPLSNVDTVKLKKVLLAMFNSKIINPEHRSDGTGAAGDKIENHNFNTIIEGLLGQDSFSSLGMTVPDLSGVEWEDKTVDNVTVKGEISRLIDIIDYLKKDGAFLLEGDVSIDSISGSILEETLNLLSKSAIFEPSLGNILNENVSPMLNVLGVDIDFNSVTDWENEGHQLSIVIDQLKIIGKNDQEKIDLSAIDWLNADKNRLNAVLTAFSRTEVMGIHKNESGSYIDNFGVLMASVFTSEQFGDFLGDSIDGQTFSSCDPKTGQSRGWKWVDSTENVTVEENATSEELTVTKVGEIKNLMNVLLHLDEEAVDKISLGTIETNVLRNILHTIIDTNTLNPVLPNVIHTFISAVPRVILDSDNEINMADLNLGVFYDMTRNQEKEEVDNLLIVYDMTKAEGNSPSRLQTIMDNIDDLDTQSRADLKLLLDTMAVLKSFTEPNIGSYLSLHQNVISGILNYISIDQMVTNLQGQKAKSKIAMRSIIMSIDDWLDIKTEIGENSRLLDLLDVLKNEKIKMDSLTDSGNLAPKSINALLNSLNESGLLHQAVPTIISQVFTSIGIEELITVDGKIYYPVDYFVHMTSSKIDHDYWKNEIFHLENLADSLYGDDEKAYVAVSKLKFGAEIEVGHKDGQVKKSALADILIPINNMQLLYNNKENIVYNILYTDKDDSNEETGVLGLIRKISIAKGNQRAAHIRKLLFPYAGTDEDLRAQTNILSSFIDDMDGNLNASFGYSGQPSTLEPRLGYTFMANTLDVKYDIDDKGNTTVAAVKKSMFGSEIVAGFIDRGLGKLTANEYEKKALDLLLYAVDPTTGKDYLRINAVEGRGLEGLLKLSQINWAQDFSEIKGTLVSCFTLMGQNDSDIAALSTIDDVNTPDIDEGRENALLVYTHQSYYSSPGETNSINNSKLATMFTNQYLPDASITTMKNIAKANGYSYWVGDQQFVFGEFAKALNK